MNVFEFTMFLFVLFGIWAAKSYFDDLLLKTSPDDWKAKKLREAERRAYGRKMAGDAAGKSIALVRGWFKK